MHRKNIPDLKTDADADILSAILQKAKKYFSEENGKEEQSQLSSLETQIRTFH